MKTSKLTFDILLDDKNVPETIVWDATDKPDATSSQTKAMAVALWDHDQQNTMRMDLWTKEMGVEDMKRFCVNAIGGIGDTLLSSTGDNKMAERIDQLCQDLVKQMEEDQKA